MKITVISVGKIKEKYFSAAVEEYAKRLSRYCRLQVIEVADEPAPEQAGEKTERLILQTEGKRVLERIAPDGYVIALAIAGKRYDSPALSRHMSTLMVNGKSHLVFLIGGSLGLSGEVLARADETLSFSDLTFPHQLMRVILLEQIYRCFRIMHGEPYHK